MERLRFENEIRDLEIAETIERDVGTIAPQIDLVCIYLFDPGDIFQKRDKLRKQFIAKLEEKFNALNQSFLKKARFKFRVIYRSGEPSKKEKAAFRKLDFPVYLLGSQHSEGVVTDLMEEHKIPETVKGEDIYKIARDAWSSKDLRGVGIPSDTGYRKVGFIKTQKVFEQANDLAQGFVNVTAHEIGHMGNITRHSKKGLMKYPLPLDQNLDFDSQDQIYFISNLIRLKNLKNGETSQREFSDREYDNPLDAVKTDIYPKALKRIEHFHARKSPVPSATAPSTVSVEILAPEEMNPGFIDRTQDEIIVDKTAAGLDARLKDLVKQNYDKYKTEIKLALVDLTGGKLFSPDYAGWHSTVSTYGASAVKAVIIYAAQQLRFDLNQLAAREKITTKNDLLKAFRRKWTAAKFPSGPALSDKDYSFTENAPNPVKVDFTNDYKTRIRNIKTHAGNSASTQLIKQIGFHYIGSVVAQSGLWYLKRKGLWIRGAYDGGKTIWADSPVGGNIHNATALSFATFYTLLAQGRLVDDRASGEIKNVLESASWFENALKKEYEGLVRAGARAAMPALKVFSKVGVYGNFRHDAGFIERDRFRYAAVVLTEYKASKTDILEHLIVDFDKLIESKNP